MRTFLEMVLSGDLQSEDIDDFIDRWHEGGDTGTLAESLGMSDDEYALWVIKSDALDLIIEARSAGMRLEKLATPALSA